MDSSDQASSTEVKQLSEAYLGLRVSLGQMASSISCTAVELSYEVCLGPMVRLDVPGFHSVACRTWAGLEYQSCEVQTGESV